VVDRNHGVQPAEPGVGKPPAAVGVEIDVVCRVAAIEYRDAIVERDDDPRSHDRRMHDFLRADVVMEHASGSTPSRQLDPEHAQQPEVGRRVWRQRVEGFEIVEPTRLRPALAQVLTVALFAYPVATRVGNQYVEYAQDGRNADKNRFDRRDGFLREQSVVSRDELHGDAEHREPRRPALEHVPQHQMHADPP
jgi:hypothetical protein